MLIKCDEEKLANLLNAKIEHIFDEAARVYTLKSKDCRGILLSLLISEYESEISISLKLNESYHSIFSITSNRVEKIDCNLEKIICETDLITICIFFKECFSLSIGFKENILISAKNLAAVPLRYKNYELVDLFNNIPEVIDKEKSIYRYIAEDKNIKLSLSLVFSEKTKNGQLVLFNSDERLIFKLELVNIEEIKIEDKNLKIFLNNFVEPVKVNFYQGFNLDLHLDKLKY